MAAMGGARKPVNTLWRGSLLPLGSEAAPSSPPQLFRHISVGLFLGLLRSPAGASSLATGSGDIWGNGIEQDQHGCLLG